MAKIERNGIVYGSDNSKDIKFDKTVKNELSAENVQDAIDEINSSLYIADDNKNITFGKNGDGNYGFYKADGSFVPFKTGDGVDFLSLAPEFDDNETYTHDSIVLKDNDLYQYIGDEDTFNGAWDATKWNMVMIPDISKANGNSSGGGSEPTPEPTPIDLEPVLLWTNPSTTMGAETITLDLTEYAGVLIESQSYMGSGGSGSRLYVKKGERLSAGRNNTNNSSGGGARAISVTDSGVTFEECYFAADKNNAAIIPTKIYGVKEYVVEPVAVAPELLTFYKGSGARALFVDTSTKTSHVASGNVTYDSTYFKYDSGVVKANKAGLYVKAYDNTVTEIDAIVGTQLDISSDSGISCIYPII